MSLRLTHCSIICQVIPLLTIIIILDKNDKQQENLYMQGFVGLIGYNEFPIGVSRKSEKSVGDGQAKEREQSKQQDE